ncbi:Thy1, putative thymidylate synthase complementing protein [Rhodococcus phage E3]|uniref:thymidylate synthase n=1 Tax=Rhodococcus phage E3 TaxID=1007869 RepID=UPI0002C6BBB6|nr:thymidylate synthase [Rhodococcus phage E3]AEQ20980.1 Thy1, putative thymidylate synthase complementing protein [Rhodococcus phage E3]
MTKTATLDVQMIGYTVFVPPETPGELLGATDVLFDPDDCNIVIDDDGDNIYDGQALVEFAGRACYQSFHRPNPKTATNRTYLANTQRQRHGSIEEHASVSFWFTGLSRTCSHEVVRHRHFSYSQLSQRYVDSNGAAIVLPPAVVQLGLAHLFDEVDDAVSDAYSVIQKALIDAGLKKKQANQAARAVLMGATETRMVMTGNYRAWKGFLTQRDSEAADPEIRALAQSIGRQLSSHAPHLFNAEARDLWDTSDEHGTVAVTEAEFPAMVE